MSGSYLNDPRYAPQPQYPQQFVGVGASYPYPGPIPGQVVNPQFPPGQPGTLPALARYRTAIAQKQQLDAALQSAGTEIRTDISARVQALKAILMGEAKAFLPEEETIRIVHELEHYASVLTPPAPQPAAQVVPPQPQAVTEPVPPQAPPNSG